MGACVCAREIDFLCVECSVCVHVCGMCIIIIAWTCT